MLQTISILLENKPGALLRVTGVLSARGYNIEGLTVAKTLDPELSRMTITVDVEERLRTQEHRTAVLKEAEIFQARVVDSSLDGFALEATGVTEKLDEFIDVMRSYGESEVSRSGAVAMSLETKKLRLQPPVPTGAGAQTV